MSKFKAYFSSGEHWVWLNAGGIATCLVMVVGLTLFIAYKGLAYFWPNHIVAIEVEAEGKRSDYLGEIHNTNERKTLEGLKQEWLLKVGNRDLYGIDFKWFDTDDISPNIEKPKDAVVVERREWGNAFGFYSRIEINGVVTQASDDDFAQILEDELERVDGLLDKAHDIQSSEIDAINYELESLRLERRRYELDNELTAEVEKEIAQQEQALRDSFEIYQEQMSKIWVDIRGNYLVIKSADKQEISIGTDLIVRYYQPNAFGIFGKIGFFFEKIHEFIFDEPREANTEGGVFPAIFGTVMMVILMSILVTPMGVVAAIYLREYASQGIATRIVRISVNNLAGVPSIVYGVFGLGFFVYFLGGSIDDLFYPEAKPAPTFGTPGLIWAAFTLALLTLPVVIVSTEEGLARIPKAIKEGSLALGATKFETLWRTILPMSSPAIMTGLILAVARAAGEVAPLMLVGVVKLAPSLPVDGNPPFIHLERKFMHLGFHIYDVGFQSPNVEAARPLVYATALLLIIIIVLLNLLAVRIRNNLREKYKSLEN
ncbi:MAG: phosphate ABC transporter permease PstA [Pseudomonadota bacterium]